MLGVEEQMKADVSKLKQYISDWKHDIDTGKYLKPQPF